jgi:predicted naringenin-chalcone synthase
MTVAHINRIGTAVPDHDIHEAFIAFARDLLPDDRTRGLFDRMAQRSGIAHRYAGLRPGNLAAGEVDADGFYRRGRFPGTAARMALYESQALHLALRAVAALELAPKRDRITHLIVASCTGFTAPGLDLQLAHRLGLRSDVERTMIGFMGCSAAVPALRAASHAVRSDPAASVLVVNLELCSLHMQETSNMEDILSFLLFADGGTAALVTADATGIALGDFRSAVIPDSEDLIMWHLGDQGFRMHLSGKVPGRIAEALRDELTRADPCGILRGEGTQAVDLWAVHAGGRTVLDAVEIGLSLPPLALAESRAVLRDFGNMSSATVMFVLDRMLRCAGSQGQRGLALAFGPGMVAETFRFDLARGSRR